MDKDWLVLREIRCYNRVMDLNTYLDAITNKCFDKFGQFQRLLTEHNKICNLTSVTDERDVLYKHFLDSVAGEFLFDKGAEIVEIGSGGGFPSIPLKLLRNDLRFTLIESTGKKCAYLQSVVDKMGLDHVDRNILCTMIDKFKGGPVGLDTLAAAIGEDAGTIEDVYEPYLIKNGFINRTPRGRVVTEHTYHHLGLPYDG